MTNDQKQQAASFQGLPESRKREILDHIEATGGARRQATVAQLIENGGPEAEFMQHIFGKDVPDQGAAPSNKKLNPPMVKGGHLPHNRSQSLND